MTSERPTTDRPNHVQAEDRELDTLFELLHREHGFDFSGYKRASLARRVRQRMALLGIGSLADYARHVERNGEELAALFNTLLINVTAFFRDLVAWEALAARVRERLSADGDSAVRVWSAGCSSGEEAYTLAIVLFEALGAEAFERRVKIYATDVDEDALSLARLATYPRQALEEAPPTLVEKHFTWTGDRATLRNELRRAVVFGRHDILQDAPIPQVDVLVCRNLLMYLNASTQERVLESLRFAVKPGGILFLGRAEMLVSHSHLFAPLDLRLRLFTPRARDERSEPLSSTTSDDPRPRRSTPLPELQSAPRRAELATLLDRSREELRNLRHELDAMRAALQAAHQELETTNEELKSSSEELETVTEELQSTNEELQTLNEELRQRGAELNATSTLLGSVLAAAPGGVLVVDRELRVQVWSSRMTDLFGVDAGDVLGRELASVAIAHLGLRGLEAVAALVRAALDTRIEGVATLDGTARAGKKTTCEARVAPLLGTRPNGVIVFVREVG